MESDLITDFEWIISFKAQLSIALVFVVYGLKVKLILRERYTDDFTD